MLEKFSLRVLLPGLFLLLIPALLLGQFGAVVQGTVADSSGAVISDAKVTLTSNETQRKQTATTSSDGFYRFTGLAPGNYTLQAEAPNFSQQVLQNVIVKAEEPTGVNLTLTPGEVSQSVTVTGNTEPTLQTENAEIGREISEREVTALPQFGRDPYELIRTAPNVTADMARNGSGNSVGLPNTTGPGGSNTSIFQTENQVPVSANGQRLSDNDYMLDGVSVNSLDWGGAAVVTPNQESVKQVVVLTNAYSAEWGRDSGAQISVVSKNGTDQLHGSGLFHYDSDNLNAYNRWGGPGGALPTRDNNTYRQFAGSLGGPIIKDKLFWFFSYEGLRQTTDGTYTDWVETPQYLQSVIAMRPGSVTTKILQSPGVAPRVLNVLNAPCPGGFGPGTCKQVAGGIDVGSFAGQTGQYIDPLLGGGLDGVPDLEFAQIAAPATNRGNQYNGRIDYDPTSKDFIALSMYFTQLYDLGSDTSTGSRPMADVNFDPLNTAVTVTYTRTLSATMLNEARANLTRFAANQVTSNAGVVNWGIPRLEVQGYPISRLEFGAAQGEATPGIFAQNTYEFRDTLSKVLGNHGLKFGVEIRREQDNNTFIGASRPDYVFNGLWNLANSTPIFEGVAANPLTGGPATSQRYLRTPYDGLFVQDDWKVRPNLTINLGLRWEYFSPPYQKGGTIGNIMFGPDGLADSKIVPIHQLYGSDYKNYAPRLGFAWSPKGNTNFVIRGGAGIFYDRIPEALFAQALANPPGAATYGICCGSSTNPFVGGSIVYALGTSSSPFSYPANPKLAQGINPATGSPNGGAVEIYGAQQYMPNPIVYVYSFGIEYKLPWKIALDLGYSGSEGHHLVRLVNQNYLYPNNLNLNGAAAFTAVYIPQPDDNSNFNAGLVTLRRNYDHGLQFVFNYRWAKSLDNSSYEGPGFVTNQTYPQNNRLERGPSDFDVTQIYNLATVWDIPTPGKYHGFWKSVLGGWQMDPIITWHTGFPWTPVTGQSVETPGGPSLSPIRPTVYFGGAGSSQSNNAFMTGSNFPATNATCSNGGANPGGCYFNITASGPPGIGRNSFRGPHFFQTDFSFAKNTRLPFFFGETSTLELRANFFNIFNQLNLQPFSFGGAGTHPDDPFFGISPGGLAGRVVELQARFSF
jgi:hypothetical protein